MRRGIITARITRIGRFTVIGVNTVIFIICSKTRVKRWRCGEATTGEYTL
jgi:hypothetical protein